MLIKEEGNKVNFIDKNDLFIGYDLSQHCCESAGYYFNNVPTPYKWDGSCELLVHADDVEDYVFNPDYVQPNLEPESDLDDGGIVVFEIRADGKPNLYLHIYNAHNGYYGHEYLTNLPCGGGGL